jgi:parallel beta-helix repeat protein
MKTMLIAAALTAIAAAQPPTCQGVKIQPGAEIQDIVAPHPPGTTYCVTSGTYRLTKTITLKRGDKLIGGLPKPVLNGAKLIAEWKPQGNTWMATRQTQRSELSWRPNFPEIADPTAQYNEDVFIDDKPLRRVLSLAEVQPGSFFFDYDQAAIYIADNPAGHRVECGATENAVVTHSDDVTIQGLIIEKYTVSGVSANSALVEDNEVRYVHGSGIRFGSHARILHNFAHHNGKYGMNGSGESPLIEGNELAYNNAARYRTKKGGGCWDAGGTKFVYSNHLVVRNNYSHNNYCDGFWSDIDNINTIYENNRIENNWRHGIFLEIGYAAVVRNNHIKGNMAAGIYLNSTGDQDIYNNIIEDNGVGTPEWLPILDVLRGGILIVQQKRGEGKFGEHLANNNHVHDNTIRMAAGLTGPTKAQGNAAVSTQHNVFNNNHYVVPDLAGKWWSGEDGPLSWTQWQKSGQDTEGTVGQAIAVCGLPGCAAAVWK